jgi:hypothetical protein
MARIKRIKKINFDLNMSGYYLFQIDKDIVADTDNLFKASNVLTKGFVGLSSGGLVGIRPRRKIYTDANGNIFIIVNGYLDTFINTKQNYMLTSSKIYGEEFVKKLQKLRQQKQQKQ